MIQFYQFIPLISHLGGRMSFPGHSLRMETNRMAIRTDFFVELERGVQAALETYSNVHRGSGHFSMVSTRLFEAAREIILEYLRLDKKRYVIVFCTPERAEILKTKLKPSNPTVLSSRDIGLPLGLRALAIKKRALPKGVPFQTGGGTVKMVSHDSLIWADARDKFEAGTPAIVSAIALTKALQIIQAGGKNFFSGSDDSIEPPAQILRIFQVWVSGLSGGGILHLTGLSLELCRQRTAGT